MKDYDENEDTEGFIVIGTSDFSIILLRIGKKG